MYAWLVFIPVYLHPLEKWQAPIINPAFVYNGKLYMIFRGNNDSSKHYIMIYDGVSAELIDPEQAGGLKSFVEMMFM